MEPFLTFGVLITRFASFILLAYSLASTRTDPHKHIGRTVGRQGESRYVATEIRCGRVDLWRYSPIWDI